MIEYQALANNPYFGGLLLFKWLNRRSQRRSYNWAGFQALLREYRVEPLLLKQFTPGLGDYTQEHEVLFAGKILEQAVG